MIPRYNNFKSQRMASTREILPKGGYVCKIMGAEVKTTQFGSRLDISIDVSEGEFKEFFSRDYRNQLEGDKKWRGVWRVNLPNGSGDQYDTYRQADVNNLAAVLEECNPGYTWDWDETHLKGKSIGILFREFEWEFNGNQGVSTEAYSCTDLDSIRAGKYKIKGCRKRKQKEETPEAGSYGASSPIVDDSDLPF